MTRFWIPGGRRLLVLPPIVVGVVALVVLTRSSKGPQEVEATERSTSVRVLQAVERDVVPRVIGYGVVEPGRIWQVVAQVAGRVVEKNPLAEAGALLAAGTELVRIDARAYELVLRQTEAQIAKVEADLVELATREANTIRTLDIESRSLATFKREYERKQNLLTDKVVAQSEVDQEESRYLQQLVRVGDLENLMTLIPAQRGALEAQKRADEAKLETARLELSYTTITAPYPCRLVRIGFEEAQFVRVGEVLAEAHGIEMVEIAAQVPVARLRHLIPEMPTGQTFVSNILQDDIIDQLGLSAHVRLRSGDFRADWNARVERIGATLDPETRTMSVVVVVDEPYAQAIRGRRPPLVQGMFCEVELSGRPKPGRVVLPRAAVHAGEIYVVEDDRLRRRPITIDFALHDFVCLTAGLADGETVVVSDPIPAIEGMLLSTTLDEELEARLARVASGEAEIR